MKYALVVCDKSTMQPLSEVTNGQAYLLIKNFNSYATAKAYMVSEYREYYKFAGAFILLMSTQSKSGQSPELEFKAKDSRFLIDRHHKLDSPEINKLVEDIKILLMEQEQVPTLDLFLAPDNALLLSMSPIASIDNSRYKVRTRDVYELVYIFADEKEPNKIVLWDDLGKEQLGQGLTWMTNLFNQAMNEPKAAKIPAHASVGNTEYTERAIKGLLLRKLESSPLFMPRISLHMTMLKYWGDEVNFDYPELYEGWAPGEKPKLKHLLIPGNEYRYN